MEKIKLILEALSKMQKLQVSTWNAPHHTFSDNLFNSPKDTRVTIPLQEPDRISDHGQKVANHFAKHNIRIADYAKGQAIETIQTQQGQKERPIAIARALTKTGGDHLVSGFANDPSRAASKKNVHSDYQVTISRHPNDVAGMTSRGQSWVNQSCMNFETGSNRGHLRYDVKEGTHVAYLHHKDDKDLKQPLARIALKPFHNDDDANDKILRPESRVYGSGPDAFNHTVAKYLDEKLPATSGESYTKNENVYHDSGSRNYFAVNSDKDFDKYIDKIRRNSDLVPNQSDLGNFRLNTAINHPRFASRHIDKFIDDPTTHESLVNNTKDRPYLLKPEHINKIIEHHGAVMNAPVPVGGRPSAYDHIYRSQHILEKLSRHPATKAEHLNKLLDLSENAAGRKVGDFHKQLPAYVITHPNLPNETMDKFLNPKEESHLGERLTLVNNSGRLTSDHITKLLDKASSTNNLKKLPLVNTIQYNRQNITSKHIDTILDNFKDDDWTPDAYSYTHKHPIQALAQNAGNIPALNKQHVSNMMDAANKDNKVRIQNGIARSGAPHLLSKEHLDDIISRRGTGNALREVVLAHNEGKLKLHPDQIHAMVHHDSDTTRELATGIKGLADEHKNTLLNDKYADIRDAMKENKPLARNREVTDL